MEIKPILKVAANSKTENRIVAKVVNTGKEYKAGDTTITALKASTVELKAGELLLIIGPSGSGKLHCSLYLAV